MLKIWIATQMDKCSFIKGQLALIVWMEIISDKASRVLWRNLQSWKQNIVLADILGITKYEDEGIASGCSLAGFPKGETFSPKVLKEASWCVIRGRILKKDQYLVKDWKQKNIQ